MRALIIKNSPVEGLGRYERHLFEQAIEFDTVHTYQDQPLPDPGEHELVVVGGTPICVRDCGVHPFLVRERDYLERRSRADLPTLGICFGAQLLASVLGAEVSRSPVMEIGGYAVLRTQRGAEDPLLAGFPDRFPVFHWHGDTFDVPSGAELLVEGNACRNQMFRHGRLIGVQFHMEVTVPMARRWTVEYVEELECVGKSADQVMEECREEQGMMTVLARRFMDNLLEEVEGSAP